MYASSFGLTESPFSISPDPRYLYMSRRHQEAMAHLRYGIQEAGGFVLLTGEVGTGKTTVCRSMLEQLPDNVDVALILNPQIGDSELLAVLCDEIGLIYPDGASPKKLLDLLNERLIDTFSRGRRTVLVIDEAQMLSREVLEQIRILTNLETTRQKLLQIILIGQPELAEILARQDLRQLAQRITARYHLEPLTSSEAAEYVRYRLGVAGCHRDVFTRGAYRRLYRHTKGVPRLINVICERAMLGAYSGDRRRVTAAMISRAAQEVFGAGRRRSRGMGWWATALGLASVAAVAVVRPDWIDTGIERIMRAGPPVTVGAGETISPKPPDAVPEPAAAQPAPEPEGIDEAELPLADLLVSEHAASSEAAALVRLLGSWRIAAGGLDDGSCDSIADLYGLHCLRGQGNWQDLESYNRVAALGMRHGQGLSYVIVTGLEPGRALLAGRDEIYGFDRSELGRYWDGSFLLLWRAPPRGTQAISLNSDGVDVLWLRQTLNRVPGLQPLEVDNTRFDASLKERVMTFQESNDLRVDGVAGVHTIIRLNSIVDPDVPRLDPLPG